MYTTFSSLNPTLSIDLSWDTYVLLPSPVFTDWRESQWKRRKPKTPVVVAAAAEVPTKPQTKDWKFCRTKWTKPCLVCLSLTGKTKGNNALKTTYIVGENVCLCPYTSKKRKYKYSNMTTRMCFSGMIDLSLDSIFVAIRSYSSLARNSWNFRLT